jgi:hypothetical protein
LTCLGRLDPHPEFDSEDAVDWADVPKVSTIVIAGLGGGGGILLGLSRFFGDKKLQDWKGEIDSKLQRLDSALRHRNYLLQRLAEFELEAITGCWRAARACLPLINVTRPIDSGTDEDDLRVNAANLSEGHHKLIEAIGRHDCFFRALLSKRWMRSDAWFGRSSRRFAYIGPSWIHGGSKAR